MAATITSILEALKNVEPEALSKVRPDKDGAKIIKELGPEMDEAIKAFDAAKQMKRYADSQKELWEEKIRLALDGATVGTIDGKPVIKVNSSHSSHYSAQILRDAYPEAAEAAYKETPYTYLTVVH